MITPSLSLSPEPWCEVLCADMDEKRATENTILNSVSSYRRKSDFCRGRAVHQWRIHHRLLSHDGVFFLGVTAFLRERRTIIYATVHLVRLPLTATSSVGCGDDGFLDFLRSLSLLLSVGGKGKLVDDNDKPMENKYHHHTARDESGKRLARRASAPITLGRGRLGHGLLRIYQSVKRKRFELEQNSRAASTGGCCRVCEVCHYLKNKIALRFACRL